MDRREIARQLARYLLWIYLISNGVTLCMIQIWYSGMSDSLEGNQGRFIITIICLMWILPLTHYSVTIFLNLVPRIRQSWLYCACSFFVLPLISTPLTYFGSEGQVSNQALLTPLILTTIIYFLVLGYFFIKFFRQHNHKIIQ